MRIGYFSASTDEKVTTLKLDKLIYAVLLSLPTSLSAAQQNFNFQVNMLKTELDRSTLDAKDDTVIDLLPRAAPGSNSLRLKALAKPLADDNSHVQVEIRIENLNSYPLDQISVKFDENESTTALMSDITRDAYNTQLLSPGFVVKAGRLAPFGVSRIVLRVAKDFTPRLTGKVVFEKGSGEGQTSTNILVTPDQQELWTVSSDTGEVVVYSLPTKVQIKRLTVGTKPSSLAYQKAMNWIVVSDSQSNTVTIIDRSSKTILNVLGEGASFGRELRNLLVSQAQAKIYVTSYVEGLLTEITLDSAGQQIGERAMSIGPRPTGMSLTFDESFLYVAHFLPRGAIVENESWVSIIDLKKFMKSNEGIIEDSFNPKNPRMQCLADFYNSYLPAKAIYGKLSAEDLSLEGAASQLAGVFLDPSGQTAWVPGTRITGALVVLERGENADPSLQRFGGLQPGQFSAPLIFPLDARNPAQLEPYYARDIEMAIPTLKKVVKCMRHPLEIEFIDRALLKSKKEQINPFLAYGVPHAGMTGIGLVNTIQFSKGGRRVFLLSHSSDEIAVYDGTTMHPSSQLHLQLPGANPKGMALTPDFKKAYVLYENSGFISELDTSAYASDDASKLPQPMEVPYKYSVNRKSVIQLGAVVGFPLVRNIEQVDERPRIKVLGKLELTAQDSLSPAMRQGKILFSSANPDKYKVSMNRLGACISCHPDGGSDGSSWVTMEGPRRTMSLRGGVANRGWLHASATHPTIQEFVEQIIPERLGGQLTPSEMANVALYVGEGIPKLQSPRVDAVKAERGRKLFVSYCQGCHAGSEYSSDTKADGTPRLFNIGTGSLDHHVGAGRFSSVLLGISDPASKELLELLRGDRLMGPGDRVQEILDYRQRPVRNIGELKAPSLTNVSDYAVYFHDASVATLKEAISRINQLLKFGLKDDQIDDLEEYLKTL